MQRRKDTVQTRGLRFGTFPTKVIFVYWLAAAQRSMFVANFLPILAAELLGKFVLRIHIGKIQESSERWKFVAILKLLRPDNPWKLCDKNPVRHEKAFQLQRSDASPQVGQTQLAVLVRPDGR